LRDEGAADEVGEETSTRQDSVEDALDDASVTPGKDVG
jgi:hypothetical protein